MNELTPPLDRLGDVLERAAAAELAAAAPQRRRLLRPRLLIAVAAVAGLLSGGGALAAQLLDGKDVADGLVAGTFSLQGRTASCAVVVAGVEYRCTLDRPPAPEVSDWQGTVEPSVDATKHVNGGCRSLASDGRTWECYVGTAAVDQKIIGSGFLGEYAPGPGRG